MAAVRWEINTERVEDNELIGRRIFDKSSQTCAAPEQVKSSVFDDDRLAEDISVDRLGCPNPSPYALKTLTALADGDASARELTFFGWIAEFKKNLRHIDILPDPLTAQEHKAENKWHAIIDRSADRSERAAFHLSNSLYLQFKKGRFVAPVR